MVQLKRDYYPLAEAAELLGDKVDDLIYAAAEGRLQIYVITNWWAASRVYMTKLPPPDGWTRVYRSSAPPSASLNADETPDQVDITIGTETVFGRNGPRRWLYSLPIVGPQPVATKCLGDFRRDPDGAEIEIDCTEAVDETDVSETVDEIYRGETVEETDVSETVEETDVSETVDEDFYEALSTLNGDTTVYFCPDPPLLVSDALKQGKLVVMGSDLSTMLGQDDVGQLADLYGHPCWPTELGVALHAWMRVSADIQDGEKPGAKLRDWLKEYNRRVDAENKLSDSAIDRIATIANWDKSPGAARKKGLE